jgi:hypothetical protein
MPLVDLHLPPNPAIPPDVRAFLHEAEHRVERFRQERVTPAFVPSDFTAAYTALRALEESDLTSGRWFCEWGSGFGVAACLAALLGFDACGIEAEEELVECARRLADDFGLPVQFACGSFLPAGKVADGEFAWLVTGGPCGHRELGLDPEDFDVIYAYPWPDEERLTADLFARVARPGAVLATYHGEGAVRLRKKTGKAPGRR